MKYRYEFPRTLRVIAGACIVAATLGLPASSSAAAPDVMGGGDALLHRVADGTRSMLFYDLYSVSLYLPQFRMNRDEIGKPAVPKAVYIEILYSGDMPGDIPEGWAEELLPPLPPADTQDLRQVYYRLKLGSVIVVAYTPDSGTTVKVDGDTVFSDPGPGFINGMFDLFLGPEPVSDSLRDSLSIILKSSER